MKLNLLTITNTSMKRNDMQTIVATPGDILFQEFIEPYGLTQSGLAKSLGVPPRRINEIVLGKRAISAETGLLLSKYFGMSERFFLNLQLEFDLNKAAIKLGIARDKVPLTGEGMQPSDPTSDEWVEHSLSGGTLADFETQSAA